MKPKKFLGVQILELSMGCASRVKEFGSTDVLPFSFSLRWIRGQKEPLGYALTPIFEGDIEDPKFPKGKSSLEISI